jgi:hypothetical protein
MQSVKTQRNLNKRPYAISDFPLPRPHLVFNKQRVRKDINQRIEHERRLVNTVRKLRPIFLSFTAMDTTSALPVVSYI